MDGLKIYKIQDLSNQLVNQILEQGLSDMNENPALERNYSPAYAYDHANLFYLLAQGRFQQGCYYVLTDKNDRYIGSAGWNHHDKITALVMVRMYVSKEYRSSYILGHTILPGIIKDVDRYRRIWMTMNQYNKSLYAWFLRKERTGNSGMANWPEIYNNFKPIGIRVVNSVDQFVVELDKGKYMTREQKLALLIEGIVELSNVVRSSLTMTQSTTVSELKLDSFDIVELQMFYEDKTGTMIPDSTKPLVTVGDLLELLP